MEHRCIIKKFTKALGFDCCGGNNHTQVFAFKQELLQVAEQEIDLQVDEAVVNWIVEHGVDAQFGARPLKRFVQRHLETIVAKELLRGEVAAGDALRIMMQDDDIQIVKL